MAVGSNTLGLLFKIGVDAKDAEKEISGIRDALKEGFGQGVTQGVKDLEKGLTSSGTALQKFGAQAQQARAGVNEVFSGSVIQGAINLSRALGPLGIALAGIAAAAAAVGFAIKGAVDASEEIGTTSKDAFDALQKKVQSAGESITELQRGMAQGILAALDKISGATTAFFAKVLEKDGPALIALFNDIAAFITGQLIPLVDKYGDTIADMIARTIALGRVLTKDYSLKDYLTFLPTLEADFAKAYADVKTAIAAIHPAATALVETTKAHKKALEDLTEAQLKENEAERALAVQREDAAAQEAEIARALRVGAITADEALARRNAILQNTKSAEDTFFDAQKRRIEAEVQGDRRRTDALEQNAKDREIAEKKHAEAQIEAGTQLDKDQTKFTESRLKQLDQIIEKEKDLDAIIKERARISPPGAPVGVEAQIPAIEPEIKLPKPVGGFFDDLQKSLESSISTFTTWGDLVGKILGQFAQATEQAFAAFILTGKLSGQIFKQLVAQIIASLAIESTIKAIFEYAEAAAAFAVGDIPGGIKHTAAAHIYTAVAVAAGVAGLAIGAAGGLGGGGAAGAEGGGFGGETAPGTLTINQGAGGGQLGVLLSIDNHLSNITTAPPGDILQRGASQNPMAVGEANNEAARRNGSISREFLQISGLRTA